MRQIDTQVPAILPGAACHLYERLGACCTSWSADYMFDVKRCGSCKLIRTFSAESMLLDAALVRFRRRTFVFQKCTMRERWRRLVDITFCISGVSFDVCF